MSLVYILIECMFLDTGSSCDERAPQRSDTDGGGGRRDSFGHVEEIHCLCQSVSLLPSLEDDFRKDCVYM